MMNRMRTPLSLVAMLLAVLVLAGCSEKDDGASESPTASPTTSATARPGETATPATTLSMPKFEQLVSGLQRPTFVTNAGDGSGRLFVLEKAGRIRVIRDGKLERVPFLDISGIVGSGGNEQGLLGLAFHPDFARNGRFFVAYTATNATNTVAEYHVSNGQGVADRDSGKVLLAVADQFPNHNGGMLAFGPDGFLYISMGDGGSGGDPNGNGQNLNALLGKLLRVDVDSGDPYGIPGSNPFVGNARTKHEIWALGLRNPWRFSFDRETGDLWIADVGQNKYEEIDFQSANSKGGENYGWNTMEGDHCFSPASNCEQDGLVRPVFEYDHGKGCSVTGGYVYRGADLPGLRGAYLFTDYCSSALWATTKNGAAFETANLGELPEGVSAFGEDERGELYFVTDQGGAAYRFVPR